MSLPSVAEFFAGIGLVRAGVEAAGLDVVWANDISPVKHAVYVANFGSDEYRLCDVRDVRGADVPGVDVATATFPCIDLSLAGHRRGLAAEQSGLFFEFVRVLDEMGARRPAAVLIENVPSFVSSRGAVICTMRWRRSTGWAICAISQSSIRAGSCRSRAAGYSCSACSGPTGRPARPRCRWWTERQLQECANPMHFALRRSDDSWPRRPVSISRGE